MVRILIDTSVWLGLARDPKDLALIGIIQRLIADGELELIVPGVVVREFLANRDRVAADSGKRVSSHVRVVREAIEASGTDPNEAAAAIKLLEGLDQQAAARGKLAHRTFRSVEALIAGFPAVEATETIKTAVFDRAMKNRAPFHQGDNEAADATIVEIFSEDVSRDSSADSRWIFVTRNTEHFSAGGGNEKAPHPDYACFHDKRCEYFISLPDALRSVEPRLVSELLQAWELQQPTISELIDRFLEEAPKQHSRFYSLNALRGHAIGKKTAAKLQAKDIVEHARSRRDAGVQPTTIRHDIFDLRTVISMAENDWGILGVSTDTVDQALRVLEGQQLIAHGDDSLAGRRPTADEIERLVRFFETRAARGKAPTMRAADITLFALASGLSLEEIASLRWADFDDKGKTCKLHGKKFPLFDEGIAIIKRQPRSAPRIFPFRSRSMSARFTKAKKTLGIKGLRFLDLKQEAIARMLAAKIPLEEIEAATGLTPWSLSRHRKKILEDQTGTTTAGKTTWQRRRTRRYKSLQRVS